MDYIKREVRPLGYCLKKYLLLRFIKTIGPFLDIVDHLACVVVIGRSIDKGIAELDQLREKGLLGS